MAGNVVLYRAEQAFQGHFMPSLARVPLRPGTTCATERMAS